MVVVYDCSFCGFTYSNPGGPPAWVQPQCPNCGCTQYSERDVEQMSEYDLEELLDWAEIGRQALAGEDVTEEIEEMRDPTRVDELPGITDKSERKRRQ